MNEKYTEFVYPMQEMYKIFLMVSWLKESFNFNRKMQSCISFSFEFEVIIWCAFFYRREWVWWYIFTTRSMCLSVHPYGSHWNCLSSGPSIYLSNWLTSWLSVFRLYRGIHAFIASLLVLAQIKETFSAWCIYYLTLICCEWILRGHGLISLI